MTPHTTEADRASHTRASRGVPPASHLVRDILAGPHHTQLERRWDVRLHDGCPAVLAELLPELAHDELVRRRYTVAMQERAGLACSSIARVLDSGFRNDILWQLREQPEGQSVSQWLDEHPAASLHDVRTLGLALAEAVGEAHRAGVLLRDLDPRHIVLTGDPSSPMAVFAEAGLPKVALASSRTATSLRFELSPYEAPESLRGAACDLRSDLYGLGVILWRALTGTLPFPRGPLAPATALPDLATLRDDVPPILVEVIGRCLATRREDRLLGVGELVAALRDDAAALPALPALRGGPCRSCGAPMLREQRLCMHCGKVAEQLEPAAPGRGYALVLAGPPEHADAHACLRDVLSGLGCHGATDFPAIDRGPFPLLLIEDLQQADAQRLAARLLAAKVLVLVREPSGVTRLPAADGTLTRSIDPELRFVPLTVMAIQVLLLAAIIIAASFFGWSPSLVAVTSLYGGYVLLSSAQTLRKLTKARTAAALPLVRLSTGPAALPAVDPRVVRLTDLLELDLAGDVREHLGLVSVLLQRVADHRARLLDLEDQLEDDRLSEPLDPLVDEVVSAVQELASIDAELHGLDETAIVRGVCIARARQAAAHEIEPRLTALDRLSALQDLRARAFDRLLLAAELLRRTAALGLARES